MQQKKFLMIFEAKCFQRNLETPTPKQKPEPALFATPKSTKKQTKKYSCKLYVDFFIKIVNDETNVNTEIFNIMLMMC